MQKVDFDKDVVIYMTAGCTSRILMTCENIYDAIEICELYNYRYLDEHDFEWMLEISD